MNKARALALCGKVTRFTTRKYMSDHEIIETHRYKESEENALDLRLFAGHSVRVQSSNIIKLIME